MSKLLPQILLGCLFAVVVSAADQYDLYTTLTDPENVVRKLDSNQNSDTVVARDQVGKIHVYSISNSGVSLS